jgi:hypothetical protein
LAFTIITLAIAISSGFFTGYLLKVFSPSKKYFLDDESWEVPNLETPYYFDERGEINRDHHHEHETASIKSKQDATAHIEARLATLEETIKELVESRVKEGRPTSPASSALTNTTAILLLQSLTQKVDQLINDKTK